MTHTLENGKHKFNMTNSTPEYEMEMTCDEGFIMKGTKFFTCTRNGVWNRYPGSTKCVGV